MRNPTAAIGAALLALGFGSSVALGAPPPGGFTDPATSQWFTGLRVQIPGTGIDVGCCDQSDCRQTKAIIGADGIWVAESRLHPGEHVRVPAANVLKVPNPLANAVICEAPGGRSEFVVTTIEYGTAEALYCFVPPPTGF